MSPVSCNGSGNSAYRLDDPTLKRIHIENMANYPARAIALGYDGY